MLGAEEKDAASEALELQRQGASRKREERARLISSLEREKKVGGGLSCMCPKCRRQRQLGLEHATSPRFLFKNPLSTHTLPKIDD